MLTLLRPRFWPGHLAMIVCVALATGLGLWQYDAWHTRRADAASHITEDRPVALGTLMTGDSPFPGRSLGRPVSFGATWVGQNLYIQNRYLHGKVGYWVVTAAQVDGSQSAMPVVRGWSVHPDVPAVTGRTSIVGWLQASEGSGPIDTDPQDNIIPMMRIASLVEKVKDDLYSAYVVAKSVSGPDAPTSATNGGSLVPVTVDSVPSVSGFTALRNLLYALEWWVFGGFAIFVWFRWCRDVLYPPDPDEEPAT